MSSYAVSYEDVLAAHELIKPHIHRTALLRCQHICDLAGFDVHLKAEHLQKSSAFKVRGALNSVLRLTDEEAQKGVVTHSSGNHGQALSFAARMRGIPAYVVMPSNAPKCKQNATKGYGGNVVLCDPAVPKSRDTTAARIQEETGAVFIPPFDYAPVIAGQGTVALEILDDLQDVDCIIAPISGGGLVSGITIAAKKKKPGILVVAAEPEAACDAALSKASGQLQSFTANTIADGLRMNQLGSLTWPIVRDLTDAVVTVSEEEIIAATRMLFERAKQVVEPSGAVSVAVALSPAFRAGVGKDVKRVVCVVSGGNIDLDALPWTTPVLS